MTSSPPADRSAPPGIWQHAFSSALRIDRAQVEPLSALRCTIGVGVPLVIALVAGQPVAGTFLAIGAVLAAHST